MRIPILRLKLISCVFYDIHVHVVGGLLQLKLCAKKAQFFLLRTRSVT